MLEWNENYSIGILIFGILVAIIWLLLFLFFNYRKMLLDKIKLETNLREKQEKIQVLSEELAKQLEYEVARRIHSDHLSEYLFENSLNPIVIVEYSKEEKFKILKYNQSALEILNIKIMKECFLELFVGLESQKYALMKINEALENKKKQNFKSIIKSKNENLPMIVSVHTFIYEGKLALYFAFVDISEIVKLEQKLHNKQAMLIQKSKMEEMGKMLGNIAHQWKQPLNSLFLLCQNLKEMKQFGELDEERFEKYIKIMSEQIQFMSKTIDEFREFFKPSKEIERFGVYEAIKNILELFYKLIDKRIVIQLDIEEKVNIFSSKNEFQQIIIVLLDNAIDAIKARFLKNEINEGQIIISCNKVDKEDQFCLLKIRDNGGGINKEIGEKIFESYFTTKENGNGIGLAMVFMILEKMGGSIAYSNCNDGVEFQIKIPLAKD
ncbi:sensor histidine kinase [Helicobacter canadensis]|uniref:histidine kinase n=1 Tax=Helicobacter canadensis MIT 98-5491 TaxID=537970 RepID=C5ZWK8_9HELI|nr:HAMP domain-containing sensor histidine kinase [Helicobacter canadensis]EES89526.1 putative sensor kinase [Helicobacter canadensis MIT 98-5491]EFR48317.1 ATPase/histidine kinase/DNA gyrase B/HSP90 domain protein [Helicobacter canadensis MIT 98-5491]STO99563.1 two-component sensor histidine kinase [Helicobacter canadensis]